MCCSKHGKSNEDNPFFIPLLINKISIFLRTQGLEVKLRPIKMALIFILSQRQLLAFGLLLRMQLLRMVA